MGKRELVELTVHVHMFTYHSDGVARRAVLVSDTGDRKDAVWLPCSQVEVDDDAVAGAVTTVVLPAWLAEERGLV